MVINLRIFGLPCRVAVVARRVRFVFRYTLDCVQESIVFLFFKNSVDIFLRGKY